MADIETILKSNYLPYTPQQLNLHSSLTAIVYMDDGGLFIASRDYEKFIQHHPEFKSCRTRWLGKYHFLSSFNIYVKLLLVRTYNQSKHKSLSNCLAIA